MGSIGNLGDVSFKVNSDNGVLKAISFNDLKRNVSANFAEHLRPQDNPVLEFTSLGAPEYSMTIILSANLGYSPENEYSKLYSMLKSGNAQEFVLGGRKQGSYKWCITSLSSDIEKIFRDGRIVEIKTSVTMKETAQSSVSAGKFAFSRSKKYKGSTDATPAATGGSTYTVKKGDCLWKIAQQFYGKGSQYSKIFNSNKDKIKNANLIYPGQVLTIPA